MTYWWTHRVADVADRFPGGLYGLVLAVLLVCVLVGLAVQNPALYRWRRRRAQKADVVTPVVIVEDDESVPEVPADALLARAQRFMATGDYRSAVREWLRVMVRDLIEADAVSNLPGMTVTEVAAQGGIAVPAASGVLADASTLFSEVWYADRVADLAVGASMREFSTALRISLAARGDRPVEGADV